MIVSDLPILVSDLPILHIVEFADDNSIENAFIADVHNIHYHLCGKGASHEITLDIVDIIDTIIDNGIIYWYLNNIQYAALDINREFDNNYENNISTLIREFIRDKKITQLGI
jgi:hypothetical protein